MYLLAASGRLDAAGLFIDIAAEAAAGRFNTRPLEELPFSGSNCFEAALALAFAFALRGLPLSASNCFEEVPLAFAFALHLPFGLALCSPADSRGGGGRQRAPRCPSKPWWPGTSFDGKSLQVITI